jgi:hypothetical protein
VGNCYARFKLGLVPAVRCARRTGAPANTVEPSCRKLHAGSLAIISAFNLRKHRGEFISPDHLSLSPSRDFVLCFALNRHLKEGHIYAFVYLGLAARSGAARRTNDGTG